MIRKIILCVCCSVLVLFTGCYSTVALTPDEFKASGSSSDLTVTTKDSTEYTFLEGNYHFTGDSLSGFGLRRSGSQSDIVFDVSLPSNDLKMMEIDQFSAVKTALLGCGVAIGAMIIYRMFDHHVNAETAVTSFFEE